VTCSNCGAENREGRKFCFRCGTALAVVCAACGAANEPDDRFCGECGSALGTAAVQAGQGAALPAPISERRLVSVLFADLVGFTTLSESRDPEEVRELLTRYFETARVLITRYGGTIEKFIGDAVMAVWGAPVAQEDDAERGVRAGLDLVGAVEELGQEVNAPDLALRAGVATGEAAVTLGATNQGMVAGDLVNTASRVQSAAAPGTVLVTESTRRATEAAIVYEEAGDHDLKGKTAPMRLARAVRVIALVGGELRSVGLESPFVGRDREFRVLKDRFHASAEDRKAHLVSVTGVAGIGKSRLSWEFFKYVDGLVDTTWWHRGRCIPYGEGVTYWALAEMVRMRARIAEDEQPASAAEKLRLAVAQHVEDEDDRRFVGSRLAHLLGLEERTAPSREDLFAGWRMFFERMAQSWPVAMVFEDIQWADESLLDFIEYLLDWSRDHPVYVVTLGRPELLERRPTWGAGLRGSTSMTLDPLTPDAMDELLRGMVPGLPDELRERIRDRAEGIPLYAVETVRMLLDRGLVRRAGDRFEVEGPVEELAVPETLQALIAARLDGLPPEERALLQDASILGKTFTRAGVAALTARTEDQLEPLLGSLVRKELLSLQMDPRSPERGQYGFLQSLVQKVAHDTLSKRDRRARHLAAANFIERTWVGDEDEIVEVVASHLLDAYDLGPDAEDAGRVRDRARNTMARAGRRARSLAAMQLARGYFEQAAALCDDPEEQAGLLEQSGACAVPLGQMKEAVSLFERARDLYESSGASHAAARASARIGEALWLGDRPDEGTSTMESALAGLADAEPDHDLALLHAALGKVRFFLGRYEGAAEELDVAIDIAEALILPDVLSEALNTKGLVAGVRGRQEEQYALLKRALELALEHDLGAPAMRAYNNLSFATMTRDRWDEAREYQEAGIALGTRLGYSGPLYFLRAHLDQNLFFHGEWDPFEALIDELSSATDMSFYAGRETLSYTAGQVLIARGDVAAARTLLERSVGDPQTGDVQTRAFRHAANAAVLVAEGHHEEALTAARAALESAPTLGLSHDVVRVGLAHGLEAAVSAGDPAAAEELLRIVTNAPPGATGPFVHALVDRYRAAVAAMRGDPAGAESHFKAGIGLFRELAMPFHLAIVQLEFGEWLTSQGRTDEARPMLNEARSTFEELKAVPYLERVAAAAPDLARA
jgi:class 3 adenylate cyclase/tetratricopeptide (TPR) repeat protein